MSIWNSSLWCATAFLALASLASAGVHIVDGSGQGDFTAIQPAINASVDGDVILVHGGSYAAFTVDNKALAIYADAGADVEIAGMVQIKHVASTKTLVLSGVHVTGTSTAPAPTIALSLADNPGALRFQQCTFTGGAGLTTLNTSTDSYPPAAHCAVLSNNPNVAFVGCTLQGGSAYNDSTNCYECQGGDGGDGVLAQTSAVAVYDSFCAGGSGGTAGEYGGRGGAGYHALDWGGFASRSIFRGGAGGHAWDFIYAQGGAGGNGLWVESSAGFHLLSDTYVGGVGGTAYLFPNNHGPAGQAMFGAGLFDQIPGAARVFVAKPLADTGGSIDVTVYGQPGDQVFLPASMSSFFKYKPMVSGVWLIPFPALLPIDPMGVIPPSGVLTLQARVMSLPSGIDAAVSFMQGFIIDTRGRHVLGSPIDALLMRCISLAPDCNGNGRFDSCDLFQALSLDCDANSVPDECQPDCNGNGIADSCDITAHTSQDANHNGVPDECEPVNATWYVDASAPPGGNGSPSNPFQTIKQGLFASLSGHTVIVRDGVYTGTQNRNLDFTGRNIVVKSQNGPASCIIDCQLGGRAFLFKNGETAAARVEGFTIGSGQPSTGSFGSSAGGAMHIYSSHPTIANCVFTNCTAGADGGALYVFNSNSIVRECTFMQNSVQHIGNKAGGAVELVYGHPRLVNCSFVSNTAARFGGALALFSPDVQGQSITHCLFLSNSSLITGGAVYFSGTSIERATFDDCLFAGNSSQYGGGIGGNGKLVLTNCTLVGNQASGNGGGVERELNGQGTIVNSILWGNSSPNGAQIGITGSTTACSVDRSDCQGGQAAVSVTAGATLAWGTGNIALDPAFVQPNGPDGNPSTFQDNNYRLSLASPCIDAADNASVAQDVADLDGDSDTGEAVPFDFDFLPRFKDIASVPDSGSGSAPIVDMGAFERQP